MNRTAEEKLNYTVTGATRFQLRMKAYDGCAGDPATVTVVRDLPSLEAAQIAYIQAREASFLGASGFMEGQVFDQAEAHVARISYNGRLWRPEQTSAGGPVAEAPPLSETENLLVWMVGTRESVLEDAYTAGPDNAPDILMLHMSEGEYLIGKDRSGEVKTVIRMGPDGPVTLDDGLEALRDGDMPEP